MIRSVSMTTVRNSVAEEIFVLKVSKGIIPNGSHAQRLINALRAKVPIEKLVLEIVVLDGEPHQQPGVFGSSPEAAAFVRSIMPQLGSHRWQPTELNW
jgi:hypothetical protein